MIIMRGLYIGRFQPFHLGHFNTLKEIEETDLIDEMIIAVGSSLTSYTPRNPFTVGERIDMIQQSIIDSYDFSTMVLGISDIEYNSVWVKHIESQLPKFDVVFANNPLVGRLFKDGGYRVERTKMTDRESYSSTEIRNKIRDGDNNWKYKVSPSVYKFIMSNDLRSRIVDINKTDEAPRI